MLGLWRQVVRLGFHLLYHQFAWMYDAVAWIVSGGEWSAWRRTALQCVNPPDDALVLEVGFGTGALHVEMAARGWRMIGLDRSRAMARITRSRLSRAGVRTSLITASAVAIPLGASTVDAIVCTFPSDYIVDAAALGEFRRALKPGAEIAVVVHGVLTRGMWRRVTDALFRVTGQGSIVADRVPSHDQLVTRYRRLTAAFRAAELDVRPIPMTTPNGYAVVLTGRSAAK
ncbi:MAG: class I SAM-dependent methyltransferase [Chloroflexi bacterium]|nr:MAG: type 11 methyltransferase [Chloroflexi bacterium OLB13]MBC6957324.1 class I SAM-dependent methyltransferase [Chloroflexota bacterium]MBV6435811.1 Ubiquinone/menaquinone biosynthesis C-methyltransferase UbiE [Anaerolineae bacterium]MDL1915988.1 class I SAM-dependent methyltransferase [Anaerolineae bacterium CFX4]OQY85271.1 MAG: hypothetical protein B6D42_03670 [Anaerolineae bacterium UTCFX5]